MKTQYTQLDQIKHLWHLVDVKDKTLGRVATQIAQLLMGKSKPYFVRNIDCGDYVVVINAKSVRVTGNKPTSNVIFHLMLMGFIASLGYKIATLGILLLRPIVVKLKSQNEAKS